MAPIAAPKWPTIDFTKHPRLIVGRREKRDLEAYRINLHQDVFASLRDISVRAKASIDGMKPRAYEPFAELEAGEEYFLLDASAVPAHATDGDGSDAQLLKINADIDGLPVLPAAGLADYRYLFYGIAWETSSGFVTFVKKTDPTQALKRGSEYFVIHADKLRSLERPDLVLENDADLVIAPTFLVGFRAAPLRDLMRDVALATIRVPANVKQVASKLKGTMPLSPASQKALTENGSRLVSVARRLDLLPERLGSMKLGRKAFENNLKQNNVDVDLLLTHGTFTFDDADGVLIFLDAVEGRYFVDELGDELRRADRFSKR